MAKEKKPIKGNKVKSLKDKIFKEEFADYEVKEGMEDCWHFANETRTYAEKGFERNSKAEVFSVAYPHTYEAALAHPETITELLHAPEGYQEPVQEESEVEAPAE